MNIQFMYAQGKNLKTLMGSGSLYVLKGEDIVSNEVVEEQNIVSVSNYCAVFSSLACTSGIDTH